MILILHLVRPRALRYNGCDTQHTRGGPTIASEPHSRINQLRVTLVPRIRKPNNMVPQIPACALCARQCLVLQSQLIKRHLHKCLVVRYETVEGDKRRPHVRRVGPQLRVRGSRTLAQGATRRPRHIMQQVLELLLRCMAKHTTGIWLVIGETFTNPRTHQHTFATARRVHRGASACRFVTSNHTRKAACTVLAINT